ncbi:hypothetical protein DPMN_022180 [Dreissena polymorpha]|uniref:Uncharacterized protein n=1 Tax=Dreissena polymorpha TaxID=45954 RepID=A0A9D3Z737_DREPO|nr:hypothetical protein DPMN_071632 [Dreissena polymorpha]KAH3795490.1 hypothetical protein DPMN_149045 [Dreissena polymorpha]KAH3897984.1 hypothetical protein DPMN_022180 [Dreissena polymorpha]
MEVFPVNIVSLSRGAWRQYADMCAINAPYNAGKTMHIVKCVLFPAYNFSCRWKCDKPIFEGTQLADNGLYHSGNSTFIDAESVPHGLHKIAGRQVP